MAWTHNLGEEFETRAVILVTAKGDKLRALGNFTFFPALYFAGEAAEGTPRAALLERRKRIG
jgi:hypothetical protein